MDRYLAYWGPDHDGFQFLVEGGRHDRQPLYSHNAKYPSGGFTGERCMTHLAGPYQGRPVFFRLDDHEDRLEETFKAVEWLTMPASRSERINARMELAARNFGDSYLSLQFGSVGDVGVKPPSSVAYVLINTRDMDPFNKPYLPRRIVEEGMTVRICEPEIHRGPYSRFSAAKLGRNYLFSNINKHRAEQAGVDDGIMLDEHGNVSELSVSNLIIWKDDRLITPWQYCSPLNGITKRTMLTLAEEMFEMSTAKVQVTVRMLRTARAMFAAGTAVGPIQINRVVDADGQLVWEQTDRHARQQMRDLADAYWRVLLGRDPGYHPEWFTPVPEELLLRFRLQPNSTARSSSLESTAKLDVPRRGH